MGREFELKFAATALDHEALRARFGNLSPITMETTYYDTPSGDIRRLRWTLRRRMENGISVCTMKTPAASFGRGEWSINAPWCEETSKELFAAAMQEEIPFAQLSALCGARFSRLAKTVELPGCTVEIALDRGVLLGGGREIPLCENKIMVIKTIAIKLLTKASKNFSIYGVNRFCRRCYEWYLKKFAQLFATNSN